MKYSDTTNKDGLLQRCELYTGLGDAAISGNTLLKAQFTGLLNSRAHQIYTMVLNAQDESDIDDVNYTNFPIAIFDLVAGQQDYAFAGSDKIMEIKRLEVKLDGTNWRRVTPIDINEISKATDATTIAQNFNLDVPFYDFEANAVFFYPIPQIDVDEGARLWYARELDEFTTSDTTQEPGFIDEPFHPMLAIGASLDYAVSKGKSNAGSLAQLYADFEQRLIKYYGSKQKDRQYRFAAGYTNYE